MDTEKIYETIARRHNVTVEEVKEEMQRAINAAWEATDKDRETAAAQNRVTGDGRIPTIEEFIRYCESETMERRRHRCSSHGQNTDG